MAQFLRRKEDRFLLSYQIVITGIFLALFFLFPLVPLVGKIALFWFGAVLTSRFEHIVHASAHWPLFRSRVANRLHRLTLALIPPPAVFYRYEHLEHHEHSNVATDPTSTLTADGTCHQPLWQYLATAFDLSHVRKVWQRMRPADQRECVTSLAITAALTGVLVAVNWQVTICFWIPVTWLASPLVAALYDYLDHVPGNPYDEFAAATYRGVRSRFARLLSLLDLHNQTAHLTHHRFPGVHWSALLRVHEEWIPEYERRGSPRSRASLIDFVNPVAFFRMVWRVHRDRDTVPVGRRTPERAVA